MNEDKISGFFIPSLNNRGSSPKAVTASVDQTASPLHSTNYSQETLSLQRDTSIAQIVSRTFSGFEQEEDFEIMSLDQMNHMYTDIEAPFS